MAFLDQHQSRLPLADFVPPGSTVSESLHFFHEISNTLFLSNASGNTTTTSKALHSALSFLTTLATSPGPILDNARVLARVKAELDLATAILQHKRERLLRTTREDWVTRRQRLVEAEERMVAAILDQGGAEESTVAVVREDFRRQREDLMGEQEKKEEVVATRGRGKAFYAILRELKTAVVEAFSEWRADDAASAPGDTADQVLGQMDEGGSEAYWAGTGGGTQEPPPPPMIGGSWLEACHRLLAE